MGWSDDARLNRDHWTKNNAAYTDRSALDVVEPGCGTAYVAAWLVSRRVR